MKNFNYVTEIKIQGKSGRFWLLNQFSNFYLPFDFIYFSLKRKLCVDYMFL